MMEEMAEVIDEFLVESQENLDRLDEEFILLEKDPTSKMTLAAIFRTIHTIKGTSGFLGFDRLEKLTHQGENLLSLLRDAKLTLTEPMITALLAMVDAVRVMLSSVAENGNDGADDCVELVATLAGLAAGDSALVIPSNEATKNPTAARGTTTKKHAALLIPAKSDSSDLDIEPVVAIAEAASALGALLPDASAEPSAQLPVAAPAATTTDSAQPESRNAKIDSSIRVEVGLLDHLMNLVGELVLARNQLLAHSIRVTDAGLAESTQRVNFITSELQEGVMKTRMQPISSVWSKFPRVVRDLSLSCGKKIRLIMEGADTELDKTIIEAIKDPLTHIVRNSVDHGIESAEVRLANGKPAEGTLTLRAFHEGGQVIMEIIDDGGGIDPGRIRTKAIEKGLITTDQGTKMPDKDIIALIFAPGFSTAEQVTNVSGRGVGMDVVRTNIERIGGSLDVQSVVGQGTTLVVRIPLTLAIIPALLIGLGDTQYAISQVNLVELVGIEAAQRTQLERIGDAEVFRLRGKLLPVVNLRDVLGFGPLGDQSRARTLVVLTTDGRQFGVVVDEVRETQEIVVKPLGSLLGGIDVYAGTTIMGDGSVALILDAQGLANRARVTDDRHSPVATEQAENADERRSTRQTVVVCEVGTRRIAIPLGLVDRLEEVSQSKIEFAGGREVVQYRGGLLNIVRLANHLGIFAEPVDPMPVLVHIDGTELVGLAVDRIVEISDDCEMNEPGASNDFVESSGVVGHRVTDLIDLVRLVASTRRTPQLEYAGTWGSGETDEWEQTSDE